MEQLKELFGPQEGEGDESTQMQKGKKDAQRSSQQKGTKRGLQDDVDAIQTDFDDFFQELTESVKTPFEPATVRNILLMGVTRAGKTTLLKVLTSAGYVNQKSNVMVSGTVNARMHTFAVKKDTGSFVVINIVDTPGLFEIAGAGGTARANDKISSNIGLAGPNVDSINILLKEYPAFEGKCSLIVTHCENELDDDMEHLEAHLRRDAKITSLDKMPILFSGSIDRNQVRRKNRSEVERQFHQVEHFRSQLISHILTDCEDPMKLDAVLKYKIYQQQAEAAASELKTAIPAITDGAVTAKDDNYYRRATEVWTTFQRLLKNPLAHQYRDDLREEFQMFESAIADDPKLVAMIGME